MIKNRSELPFREEDVCGKLQELYDSENMSIAYTTITERTTPHKHQKMEEVYYVVKGKGKVRIGETITEIKPGDIIPIPKNIFHNIEEVESALELLVVTYPTFDKNDVIF